VSDRSHEPRFFEEEGEAEPQPETASAGGVRPPGRKGSGVGGDDGESQPPEGGGGGLGEGIELTDQQHSTPLEILRLTLPTYSRLQRMGLTTIGEVLDREEDDLLALGNLSLPRFVELREKINLWLSLLDANLTPDSQV
jgi:hypothetical protein